AAASLLAFVPSLGAQEAFAFGAGVALPTRFRFRRLADELLPGNQSASGPRVTAPKVVDAAFVASVVGRWRQ
ncbi:MAG: ATPase, partial [Pseudomonadota bacterium]